MKIAISTEKNNVSSLIDQRFGRSNYFLIIDLEGSNIKNIQSIPNEGNVDGHGAGIKAAEQIGNLDIDFVLTGEVGPNAKKVLDKLEIKVYKASGRASDAIKDFIDNNLEVKKIESLKKEESQSNNTEKIFFPLLNNQELNSEISEHFGHAPFFGIYDFKTKNLRIIQNNLTHTDPNKSPVDQIIEIANPTMIFTIGIGARAIKLFEEKNIDVKTGNYKTVKEVLDNVGNLESQTSDCGHEH